MDNQKFIYDEPVTNVSHYFPFLTKKHAVSDEKLDAFRYNLEKKDAQGQDTILYVHIPYCLSICMYCHCHKTAVGKNTDIERLIDDYLSFLYKEAQAYAKYKFIKTCNFKYIHIGGGTPSLLSSKQFIKFIETIKNTFSLPEKISIALEGEIRTLNDAKKIAILKKLGCERISFGVQSFDKNIRELCNLKPSMQELHDCTKKLREQGFAVNIDLLYGLPGQTEMVLQQDLDKAIELKIDSLDIYRVNIYPHVPLFLKYRHSNPEILNEKLKFRMYQFIVDHLTKNGYVQETDEIFKLSSAPYSAIKEAINKGGNNRCNILGLGSGALSLLGPFVLKNAPLKGYKNLVDAQKNPIIRMYEQNEDDMLTHMGLRGLTRGLKVDKRDEYFPKFREKYGMVLEKLKRHSLIVENDNEIRLTYEGILWHQNIQIEFLSDKQKKDMNKMSSDIQQYDKILEPSEVNNNG